MAKQNTEQNLSYLFLSILAFLTAIALEVLTGQNAIVPLPEMTMNLTVATIYVVAAALMAAFITHVKLDQEKKYILYLVVLAITFFRVFALLQGLMM